MHQVFQKKNDQVESCLKGLFSRIWSQELARLSRRRFHVVFGISELHIRSPYIIIALKSRIRITSEAEGL